MYQRGQKTVQPHVRRSRKQRSSMYHDSAACTTKRHKSSHMYDKELHVQPHVLRRDTSAATCTTLSPTKKRRIKMRIMFLAFLGLALRISLQHSQGASVDPPSLREAHTGDSDGDSKRPATYMYTTGGDGEADEDDDRQAADQDKEGIP